MERLFCSRVNLFNQNYVAAVPFHKGSVQQQQQHALFEKNEIIIMYRNEQLKYSSHSEKFKSCATHFFNRLRAMCASSNAHSDAPQQESQIGVY